MFDINAYPNGYTLMELNPKNVVLRELSRIDNPEHSTQGGPMLTGTEARALADALNMAERMIYTVTRTTQTTGDDNDPNHSLSHRANGVAETVVITFKGLNALERAQAAYKSEVDRLTLRGKWPGYVTTIEMSAAVHSIAFVEV